jgi:phosphomannomutase
LHDILRDHSTNVIMTYIGKNLYFSMTQEIFKAYDVRGIYPSEIDEDIVYKIGRAAVVELNATTIAIGRDARESGPSLHTALVSGITDAGCDVIDLGMITTPMLYFASHQLTVDGAIAVTASHNPGEYNGIKICRTDAVPVGSTSGLDTIRDMVMQNDFGPIKKEGIVSQYDIKPSYYEYFGKYAAFGDRTFTIVVDCANTMGVLELSFFTKYFPKNFNVIPLYCDLTNAYNAHEANPLKTETLDELRALVVEKKADLGLAYDGDADRIGFVDESGAIIPMDLITGLIAKVLLADHPGATILYDLRSSRAVKEVIEENGGIAHECRVGHAFIKEQMRTENALFAGELSGHYYFQANKYGEVSSLAAFTLLGLMAQSGEKISDLVSDLRRYAHSGEINSDVVDKDAVLTKIREKYSDGTITELDGIKVDYPDWWFNVRASNTEPVLRLNCEAKTEDLMVQKRDELLALIRS